jgi:hypothetical protein
MTRGNDVAQSTGSTEPRCVRPATSPWPTRHVLAHFQKPFFLHVQQKWCSRYPMPKERCKEETWPPGQVAWPTGLTSGSPSPNLRSEHHLTPPINTMVLPLTKSVKKVRFSPPPKGLLNSIFVESSEWLERGSSTGIYLGSMEFSKL